MPGDAPATISPPARVTTQLAQLVVIPALIVAAAIGAWMLFVWIAGANESLKDQVVRLRGCSSGGRGPLGVQNPAYKDCWRAAFNVANLIGQIEDADDRRDLHENLVEILGAPGDEDASLLQTYLLVAVGRLGQPGGIEVLLRWLAAPQPGSRRGALKGLRLWPDHDLPRLQRASRRALSQLRRLLNDVDADVASRAAAALGELATAEDEDVRASLQEALESAGPARRNVRWHAAISLARLGDERGTAVVAGKLLDRDQLAREADGVTGDAAKRQMQSITQDDIMLGALMFAADYTGDEIFDKISRLAESDPSPNVKKAALKVLLVRRKKEAGQDP